MELIRRREVWQGNICASKPFLPYRFDMKFPFVFFVARLRQHLSGFGIEKAFPSKAIAFNTPLYNAHSIISAYFASGTISSIRRTHKYNQCTGLLRVCISFGRSYGKERLLPNVLHRCKLNVLQGTPHQSPDITSTKSLCIYHFVSTIHLVLEKRHAASSFFLPTASL